MLWRRIVVIVLLIHAVSGLIVEHIRMFDPDGYRDLGKPSTQLEDQYAPSTRRETTSK
jgi:hypothetical protein